MPELFLGLFVLFAGFVSMIFAVFSGGGAIIILPAVLFAGAGPAGAVATTRLGVTLSSAASIPFLRGRLLIGKKIPVFLIILHAVGAVFGAVLLTILAEQLLFGFVGFVMVFGGVLTFVSKSGSVSMQKHLIKKRSVAIAGFLLFFIGIYRGFFGPASGTLNRMVYVNILKLSQIQSLALANYMAFVASVLSLIVFLFAGLVNFEIGLWLAVGTVAGAVVGVKTALLKGNKWLSKVFGVLAILIGVFLIFFR